MTFAEKLKSMRKQSGMSQEKLAEKIGIVGLRNRAILFITTGISKIPLW